MFVVLDPFWFTPRARRSYDHWYRTLGRLPSSGILRVTVSPVQVRIDYVRTDGGQGGSVAHSYVVTLR